MTRSRRPHSARLLLTATEAPMKPTARQIANEARWALERESTSAEERRAILDMRDDLWPVNHREIHMNFTGSPSVWTASGAP